MKQFYYLISVNPRELEVEEQGIKCVVIIYFEQKKIIFL